MRVLIATDSVHTTAAACDYLEPRLNGDDTVAVVTVPADEARDAEDALNVATARLLGRADVRTARLDAADGDPTEAILAAIDDRSPDTVVVGRHAGAPGAGPGLGGTARRVIEGADRPVVVVVPSV
ncbi:MAG: nucleotide-binding universal stress UspA family protein [Natronomonas sp.]|jgi:nucleotide-binding universal stress UspA family protein